MIEPEQARQPAAPTPPRSIERARVLHVITGLGVGGAESMLASLVAARPPQLEQSVVSLTRDGFHASRLRERGAEVVELGLRRASRAPMALAALASIIRRERPHVVQGWMYHGNLAALAALSLSGLRRSTRLAWGIRCSDRDSASEPLVQRAVIRAGAPLARFTDTLVANSSVGLDYHVGLGYRSSRGLVIRNGIDTSRFHPDARARDRVRRELGIGPGEVVLAHVARLHPMKDHETFLQALRGLPQVRALAVGAGTETLPDVPNLRRLGRRSDVPDLVAASDVIVSSSAYGEGFSNAIAEGMAGGLVPVATDVGDARIIVGDLGALVPIRSPGALREAVSSLVALPRAELVQRGLRARESICSRFGLDRAIQEFSRLYVDLASTLVPGGDA